VQKVLHHRMKLHAQRIQTVQTLEPDDGLQGKEFAMDMLDRIDTDSRFLDRVIFIDESTVYVSGIAHIHDCAVLGLECPHAVREYERDSFKLNVWCAPSRHEVSGPIFFREKTVNNTNYRDMFSTLQSRRWRTFNQTFTSNKIVPLHNGASQSLNKRFAGGMGDRPIPCPLLLPYLLYNPTGFFSFGAM
jgi:hypothetical protein